MSVLVTGGTKGIGLAIAERLAPEAGDVFLNYHNDDEAAEGAAERIKRAGGRAHLVKSDVGTPQGAKDVIEAVRSAIGHLDQVIHCAVYSLTGPALEIDLDEYTRAVQVNGLALLYLAQAASPLMRPGASILFLSSRGSRAAIPNYVALGTPKALAECLVKYLAVELGPKGIRANVLMAGPVDTDAFRSMFPANYQERLAAAAAANPSGRGLEIDDLVGAAQFLCSPAASMVQGQVLMVDGGLYLK